MPTMQILLYPGWDAERHRYTRGCGGCSNCFRGLARQPHTEACRERFRNLMAEEAKVADAEKKMGDQTIYSDGGHHYCSVCIRKEGRSHVGRMGAGGTGRY